MGVEYDSRRRQICSVSDDRSIRVWQVAFPSSSDGKNNGADVMNTDDWRLAEFCPIHVLYGHAARVWDAKVLADGYVSVGEVWKLIYTREKRAVLRERKEALGSRVIKWIE